jgi:hypothetical protein
VDATMLQLQGDHYTIISPEHEGWKKIQDVVLERFML